MLIGSIVALVILMQIAAYELSRYHYEIVAAVTAELLLAALWLHEAREHIATVLEVGHLLHGSGHIEALVVMVVG